MSGTGRDSVNRAKNLTIGVLAFALIAVILILDVTTGVWNDLVIISGLAAGLVTFLLTTLVVDRVVARSTERRWAPVNRFALSEFLHSIADEERSELSRGRIVPRALPSFEATPADQDLMERLEELRVLVVEERARLADALARWAQFLASNGDNNSVLRHTADLADMLEQVRDAAVEAEHDPDASALSEVSQLVAASNAAMLRLEAELRDRIKEEDALGRALLAQAPPPSAPARAESSPSVAP